jgi:site-specific DNA-methyltransferase (adenine-specific)
VDYFKDGGGRMKLINADCIEAMKAMPDNSVDAIVTDPPYELGFMGKSWDASGIAFNIEVWQEALRVIKPGGHLIAFSGSRTYHRMAVAIEDAGFQIRDQIMWVYGSGFPKSHNIEKAINKIDGVEFLEKPASGVGFMNAEGAGGYNTTINQLEQVGDSSERAATWQGWGTALKPAHEPMVLARKPVVGTVANNVLTYGTGGLNIEATRVPSDDGFEKAWDKPVSTNISAEGGKYISEGAKHTVDLGEYKPSGRFPANFIHDGSDEVVGLFPDSKGMATQKSGANINVYGGNALNESSTTFPEIREGFNDSGSAARFFYCAKASKKDRNEGLDGFEEKAIGVKGHGLARICATCSATLLTGGCDCPDRTYINPSRQNHHPTVKPTTLMQYLVRLVTPPNGTVLDPFMGSGSTGKACAYEGFDFIGIDQSAEYVAIAQARIDFALAHKDEMLEL